MADKSHSDTQEKIELISLGPGYRNTGDLEAGTHTIVPTTRPAIGSAQYSASITLPAPNDARLKVMRIAARLSVNIAGLGTATHVYCSVRVDVDDADHELFSEDWESGGAQLDAVDTHSGNKATIFDLLKDGSAHTFYFLFWADAASQATIDVVYLWEGVGTSSTSYTPVLQLNFSGIASVYVRHIREGTGSITCGVYPSAGSYDMHLARDSTGNLRLPEVVINSGNNVVLSGSVATDLLFIYQMTCNLRSER